MEKKSGFGWMILPILSLDLYNRQPDLDVVLSTAGFYRLKKSRAREIVVNICEEVGKWITRARALGLSKSECAEAEHLFMATFV